MRKTSGIYILSLLAIVASPLGGVFLAPLASAAVSNGKVYFETNRDGNNEIYSMNPDGSNQVNLTNDSSSDASMSVNYDGSKLLFVTDRHGPQAIYVMNADGSNQTRLTNNGIANDSYGRWSPDGTKIVFLSNRDGGLLEIYVMNADGSNQTRLTNNSEHEFLPNWSPNGQQIVYVRDVGNNEIYIMDGDGTNQTNLSNAAADDYSPVWSPDSNKVLFRSSRDGNQEIYVVDANGTNLTRLTNNSSNDNEGVWSPDGTKIAFTATRDGTYQIYVMDADGTDQTRITNNSYDDYIPSWSPDGNYLLFTRYDEVFESEKLYRINATGGGEILLGTMPDGSYNYAYQGSWASEVSGSSSTTINTTLNSVISMTSSGTVTLGVTPAGGARLSSGSDTVSVSTNNGAGYVLTFSNQDTTTNLVSGGNTITAHAGTQASPTSLVANRWAYRVDGVGGFGAGPTSAETNAASSTYSWAGVPSSVSPNQLRNTSATASNHVTTIWYAVMVDETIPNGTYSDTVTYTAVTN